MTDEAGHILRLDHAVLQQLGAADDALERRFQLVRDVRRELAAAALGEGLRGHVEGQQHRADHLAVGLDAAEVELVLAPAALGADLAVPVGHRRAEREAHGVLTVHGQEILPDARARHAEERLRGGIDVQHRALFVEQHEPLVHAGGDLCEFVCFLPQLGELGVDLSALAVDAPQERRELLIGVVFQRMLEVERVERLDDALGQTAREQAREHEQHDHDEQNGLERSEQQRAHRGAAGGQAQHGAVREAARAVNGLLQQRRAVAARAARAGLQRLADLLALKMVLHLRGVRLRVVEHRAVGGDPGDAETVGLDFLQIGRAVGLHGCCGDAQLVAELVLLHPLIEAVEAAHDEQQAAREHRDADGENGAEDLSGQFFSASHR